MKNTEQRTSGNGERLASLQVMVGAVLISFSGVYVKLAHVSPTVSGFYRVFIGGVILLIITMLKRERLWKSLPCFGLGIFCGFVFALDLFVWHKSIHYIGPGLATILANFQVFLLALFGVLVLGEKIRLRLILAIPLAIAGLFMIVGTDWNHLGEGYRIGIFLGLGAAVCYAGYVLTLRKLQSGDPPLSPMANLVIVSLSTAIFLAAEVWHEGDTFAIPDARSFFSLSAYGVFSQAIGWIMISRGLRNVRASVAGLLLLLQPSLAFVWDMLFFDRTAGGGSVTGAALAIAAIYMGMTGGTDQKEK